MGWGWDELNFNLSLVSLNISWTLITAAYLIWLFCIDTWGNIKNTNILKYLKYSKLKYCYIIWDWLWSSRVALSTHVLTSFIFLEKWASEYPLVPFNLYFLRQYLQQYGGRILVLLYRTPSGTWEQIYTLPKKPVKHSLGRTNRHLQSHLSYLTSMSPASFLFF